MVVLSLFNALLLCVCLVIAIAPLSTLAQTSSISVQTVAPTVLSVSVDLVDESGGTLANNATFSLRFLGLQEVSPSGTVVLSCSSDNASVPFSLSSYSSISPAGNSLSVWTGSALYCSSCSFVLTTLTNQLYTVSELVNLATSGPALNVSLDANELLVQLTLPAGWSFASSNNSLQAQWQLQAQAAVNTPLPPTTDAPIAPLLNSSSGAFVLPLLSPFAWIVGQILPPLIAGVSPTAAPVTSSLDGTSGVITLSVPKQTQAITLQFMLEVQSNLPPVPPSPYGHKRDAVILSSIVGGVLLVALLCAGVGATLHEFGVRASKVSPDDDQEEQEMEKVESTP